MIQFASRDGTCVVPGLVQSSEPDTYRNTIVVVGDFSFSPSTINVFDRKVWSVQLFRA
jgi:hypothetical protein